MVNPPFLLVVNPAFLPLLKQRLTAPGQPADQRQAPCTSLALGVCERALGGYAAEEGTAVATRPWGRGVGRGRSWNVVKMMLDLGVRLMLVKQ